MWAEVVCHVCIFFLPLTLFCLALCFNVSFNFFPKTFCVVFVFLCFYHPSVVASYASSSSGHDFFTLFISLCSNWGPITISHRTYALDIWLLREPVFPGNSVFLKPYLHGSLAYYTQWDTFKSYYYMVWNSVRRPESQVNIGDCLKNVARSVVPFVLSVS